MQEQGLMTSWTNQYVDTSRGTSGFQRKLIHAPDASTSNHHCVHGQAARAGRKHIPRATGTPGARQPPAPPPPANASGLLRFGSTTPTRLQKQAGLAGRNWTRGRMVTSLLKAKYVLCSVFGSILKHDLIYPYLDKSKTRILGQREYHSTKTNLYRIWLILQLEQGLRNLHHYPVVNTTASNTRNGLEIPWCN